MFLRPFLLALGAIALVVALPCALAGRYDLALPGALMGGGVLLMGTWAWGHTTAFPVREWVAMALVAAGIVAAGMPLFAVLLVLGVIAGNALLGVSHIRRLRKTQFDLVGADEVMAGAQPAVAAFELKDFRRVGGYSSRVHWKVVTATVMAGQGADRFAVVTDRVVEVVSRFGDRWLVTTNSGLAALPDDILRQLVARGSPMDLVAAHEAGIEVLRQRGLEPDRFRDDADVLQAAVALEERAIGFLSDGSLGKVLRVETRRKSGDPALRNDDRSRQRIDTWLSARAQVAW